MRRRPLGRGLRSATVARVLGIGILAAGWPSAAQVVPTELIRDGSIGPGRDVQPTKVGTLWELGESLGERRGRNLFHSFERFNLTTGETARFTAAPIRTDNVISRVTGGDASLINGGIESSIPGADVYLLNPAGILFGADASIDVQGSFHASTADQLRLGSSAVFSATDPGSSVLSFESPTAWGFVGGEPGLISVRADLVVPANREVSLVGGPIQVAGGKLRAPGGRVSVVSVASEGEVPVLRGEEPVLGPEWDLENLPELGSVELTEFALISTQDDEESRGQNGARSIVLRGGSLSTTTLSNLLVSTVDRDAGSIDVRVTGDVLLKSRIRSETNGSARSADILVEGARILISELGAVMSLTRGGGDAGDIVLAAENSVKVVDALTSREGTRSEVLSVTESPNGGAGGSITIRTKDLRVKNGARILTESRRDGSGPAGDIAVEVDTLKVARESELASATRGESAAGDVSVHARERVDVRGIERTGGVFAADDRRPTGIFSRTQVSSGPAGQLHIRTPELIVREGGIVSTASLAFGDGGALHVDVERVDVSGGSFIDSGTLFFGRGGDLSISASESVVVTGQGKTGSPSRIGSSTLTFGDAGDVLIETPRLEIDGGLVSTSTLGFGNVPIAITLDPLPPFTLTVREALLLVADLAPDLLPGITDLSLEDGSAGRIVIDAERLDLRNGGQIDASSFSSGRAQGLKITAGEKIRIAGSGSGIFSRPGKGGSGGGIEIATGDLVLRDGAQISIESGGDDVEAQRFAAAIGEVADRAEQEIALLELGVEIEIPPLDALPDKVFSEEDPDAGNLQIIARRVNMTEASIRAGARDANGGTVSIDVRDAVGLRDSDITTSVRGGDGGDVDLRTGSLILDRSAITARARDGDGGNIRIVTDAVVASADSVIDASSQLGIDGEIIIESPEQVVEKAVTPLPIEFLNASALLRPRCAARAMGDREGSFVVTPRGAFAASDELLLAYEPEETDVAPGALEVAMRSGRGASARPLQADPVHALEGAASRATGGSDFELAAGLFNNLGNLYAERGAGREALVAYARSADLAQQAEGAGALGLAQANAARNLIESGETDRAAVYASEAELLAAGMLEGGRRAELRLHLARSQVLLAKRDPVRREAALLKAHALLRSVANEGRERGDVVAQSRALGQLGALYQGQNRIDEALYLTQQALRLAEEAEDIRALSRWQWQLGRLYWARGEAREAIEAYRRSVVILEQTRQMSAASPLHFRQVVAPLYKDLADALLQASALVEEEERSQALLREARAAVELLKAAELRDYFRDDCVAELQARTRSLDSVSPTAAVVYPIPLAERMELLVTLPAGLKRYTVEVSADELAATVRDFRRSLQSPLTGGYLPAGQQLYDWLIRPLEAVLAAAGIDTLVFVPDGPLRMIPMAALHDGQVFLVERFALAVTPGLELVDPKHLEQEGVELLLAGISEPVRGFPALDNVPAEFAAVREVFGRGETLLNEDFVVERVEAEIQQRHPTVVHIASHGEFTGDPSTSFLLAYDQLLTMDRLGEVLGSTRYRWDDPLELLVLSACETAAGDERAALGMAGVAIRAGARSAVGSLWRISDPVSAKLFANFYRQLKDPSVTKAEALRRAQVATLDDVVSQHPRYWSPFLLIGNWL